MQHDPAIQQQMRQVTDHDLAMMRLAIDAATAAASLGEVPIGAVIYRDDKVLATAHNRREIAHDPAGHAEILALRQAGQALQSWRLDDCTMAVTLEPCPMCAGAAVNARLPRLIYGAPDPKMGAVDSLYNLCNDNRLNQRISTVPNVLKDPCAKLLQDFFQARRRRPGGAERLADSV